MKTLIDIRRELHQIPERGFQEVKTQRYLLDVISALPQEHIEVITWRTGIVVKVKGSNPQRKIGWRADMDGLPIQEETGFPWSSIHEGVMHACGHDFHMTIAIGLLQRFAFHQPKDDLIIFFQPAEEGPGGAKPMLDWLHKEYPAYVPDCIFALHIAPEYPVGTIATKPGILFANTSELFIDLKGIGGHAAFPHLTTDMTVAVANLVLQLQTIVARNINPLDSAVVTIGKMRSGTVQNVISGAARLEGTIRAMSATSMELIKERIESICQATELAFGCQVTIDYGCSYYQVVNDEKWANAILTFAERQEYTNAFSCNAAMTGEDFGSFLKDIPGAMFWTGANTPYGLHQSKIAPDEMLIDINVQFIEEFIRSIH